MRSPYRRLLLAVATSAVLLGTALPAAAAETSNAELVIIPEGEVFPGDLYAAAIRVLVEGTIEGDLVAFAAEEVVITGAVTGSVTAVTPSMRIEGVVGDSARVSALEVEVDGTVGGDLVTAAWAATLTPGSEIDGDVLVWASSLRALGTVREDLTGSQRRVELAGEVAGDVDVSVGRLVVTDSLRVGGDLGYRSANEAGGLDRATVEGAVVEKTPLPPNVRVRALGLLGRFMVVLFLTLAAVAVGYGWPDRTLAAAQAVGRSPAGNWLRGAAVVFSPIIAMTVALLVVAVAPGTVAFPLLLFLVPLILALVGLVFALGLVAGVPVVSWLGRKAFPRLDLHGWVLAGSVIAGVVWWVPLVGWLVPVLVLPLGVGAWMRSRGGQLLDRDRPASA